MNERIYTDIKIEGCTQIAVSEVKEVLSPEIETPFWTITFNDGEVINTTMPVLVAWRWEEVPNE